MKVKRIVFCLNNSPLYSGMWDIVSKVWTEKSDYIPTLIFVGTQEELDLEVKDSYGEVYLVEKHPEFIVRPELDWTVMWSCYWFMANKFPDEVCMLSGIDEIPCNNLLENMTKDVPDDKYIFLLGENPYNRTKDTGYLVANGWSVAKGSTLKRILKIEDNLKDELKRIWESKDQFAAAIPDNHQTLNRHNWWGMDEAYISYAIHDSYDVLYATKEFVDNMLFGRRICRSRNSEFDPKKLQDGYYWEAHIPRPLTNPENAKVVKEILVHLGISL